MVLRATIQAEVFTFKPLLYEYVAGDISDADVSPSFKQLLARSGVNFVQAGATEVELEEDSAVSGGAVLLENDVKVPFDWLVLSCGAESKIPSQFEGKVMTFNTMGEAIQTKKKLKVLAAVVPIC